MTDPGAPRGGRYPSGFPASPFAPGDGLADDVHGDLHGVASAYVPARYEDARHEPPLWATGAVARPFDAGARPAGAVGPASGLLDRHAAATGPLVGSAWAAGIPDSPGRPLTARHSDEEPPPGGDRDTRHDSDSRHPSAPLPPMPTGIWDRLSSREGASTDDDRTVARPLLPPTPPVPGGRAAEHADPHPDAETEAHPLDPRNWEDETGGLDVHDVHDDHDGPLHGDHEGLLHDDHDDHDSLLHDDHDGVLHDDHDDPDGLLHDEHSGGFAPVEPYEPARGRSRRRPVAVVVSLVLLAALVVGIVIGGQKLIALIDPTARDYAGQGTGTLQVKVEEGDTLSDIARTLVDAGVVASIGPFVQAAEADARSVGIQPGVYELRREMSGQAALDLMLDPVSRQLSRVTLPEGLTVEGTLARLAEATGRPESEFQAAAADPAALGLPAYANGQLEGYLFPATYDFEPDTTPAEMLREMVTTFNEVAGRLQLEQRAAALSRSPSEVVTIASMVESETRLDAERPDVAQVIYNRLGSGIALGIDATLAYGLQKNGNDLTVTDLQTDGPYNTRTRPGLPPTPISAPGEASLDAALNPTSGDLLYYVLESSDGAHFFTASYAEFQAARQRCADAGLGCGG